MSMPLDIPWITGIWADQPGFTPPGEGLVIPSGPSDISSGVWDIGEGAELLWVESIAGTGKPGMAFIENDDRLYRTPTYSNTNLLTAVIVGRLMNNLGADLIDGVGQRRLLDSDGFTWRTFAGSTVVSGGTADTNLHLFIAKFTTSGNETLEIDTQIAYDDDAGSASNAELIIGSSNNGEHFGSEIAFVGFIDRELTAQEKSDLWDWYQADYLGIGGGRSGHPKVWDGGSFSAAPAKVWDGSSWTEAPMQGYDGTTWIVSK